MKIVYCHCSVHSPGGMERVLLNKVEWLVRNGHEVVVVTTDQAGRAPFYRFPGNVRMIDLGVNYSEGNQQPLHRKIAGYLRKRRMHRRRLTEVLMTERPDVTVSLYPSESSFIPDINDGSKKVLELHFNRYFRLQYGRKGLLGLIDRMRSRRDVAVASRFDSFVVLTQEDKGYWGKMPNISVIPNAAIPMCAETADCSAKRVIAVGRLDYQKGFDRLLRIWAKVMNQRGAYGWTLHIYGQGEWGVMLRDMAKELMIDDTVTIHDPVNDIAREYLNSSMLAMTSNYEGFPMVMIEAMSLGLPVVSFDYKCGPKDIICHGHNGMIVADGDEDAFARTLASLMDDGQRRRQMGREASAVAARYSEHDVMAMWMNLFKQLVKSRK